MAKIVISARPKEGLLHDQVQPCLTKNLPTLSRVGTHRSLQTNVQSRSIKLNRDIAMSLYSPVICARTLSRTCGCYLSKENQDIKSELEPLPNMESMAAVARNQVWVCSVAIMGRGVDEGRLSNYLYIHDRIVNYRVDCSTRLRTATKEVIITTSTFPYTGPCTLVSVVRARKAAN